MFDFIHTSDDSHNTPFNSDSTHDAEPGYAAPPPDTGALLAAVGIAGPRDPRGSRLPDIYRCGRLNRGRGGLREV